MCCRCTQSYKHDRVYTLRSEEGVGLYKFYYTRFSVYIQSDFRSGLSKSWAPFLLVLKTRVDPLPTNGFLGRLFGHELVQ